MAELMKITGILPALVTPFRRGSDRIDEAAAKKLIERLLSDGADGFYILGSTGEGILMEENRRMEMCEIVVDQVAGRKPVICHTAAMNFQSALRLTKHAAAAGATAVSAIPPLFFRYELRELLLYYRQLAEVSPLPFIMYNHTAAGGGLSAESVADIFRQVDGITGVKWTVNNYSGMMRLRELTGGRINIINGPDDMLIQGLAAGADAGIGTTYNVMLPEYKAIYDAFERSDVARAGNIQRRINAVTAVMQRYGTIPATKYMCGLMGVDVGCASRPLRRLSQDEGRALETELDAVGWKPSGRVVV